MNKVELKGIITKSFVYDKVIKMTICTDDFIDKQGNVKKTYHNCVFFGDLRDKAVNYGEGQEMHVKGQYRTNMYEKDGEKLYSMQLVVSEVVRNNNFTNPPDQPDLTNDNIPF